MPLQAAGLSSTNAATSLAYVFDLPLTAPLLGGYAGELCLYEFTYIARGGEFFTRLDRSINDATEIAQILGRPQPTTVQAAEQILVEAFTLVKRKPYDLLACDLTGFRRWVSRLHATWEGEGFRSMGLRADLLPDAA